MAGVEAPWCSWELTGEGKEKGEKEGSRGGRLGGGGGLQGGRHGGGRSEQLAAPCMLSVCGLLLCVKKEGEEGRRKERRKEKEGKEKRKKRKKIWNFFQT
jgi:hypothetical protein